MAEAFYKKLGRRVAELREAQGLTQEQLAQGAAIGGAYVAHIEAGARKPTLDVLMAIARSLSIDLLELLGPAEGTRGERIRKGAVGKLARLAGELPLEDVRIVTMVVEHLLRVRKVR